MNTIDNNCKFLAKLTAGVFGGTPSINRFWDNDKKSSVDILACNSSPQPGVTSYATVNLSLAPLLKEGEEYKTRLEIVGACSSNAVDFNNAIATAAFCIINSGWFCFPGAIFPNVLDMYNCSRTMSHFFFVPPFIWDAPLDTIEIAGKNVSWLLAVPISDEEKHYAEKHSTAGLERLFTDHQIDVFDLNRPSVA